MQTSEAQSRRVAPSHSPAARRRASLKRGAACWDLDRKLCAEPTRRVAQLTLTLATDDLLAAQGQIRRFWDRVRQRHIGVRYFCWLELQRRGQVHYHALWLNPPHRLRRDLVHAVDRWWGLGRTQVRFKDARWAEKDMLEYALAYAKKMGHKRYQQDYEGVPRGLRTFMNQRLEIPPDELKHHLERDDYRYVGAHFERDPDRPGYGTLVEEYLELVGHFHHHVELLASCSARDHRRPPRTRPRAGPVAAGSQTAGRLNGGRI